MQKKKKKKNLNVREDIHIRKHSIRGNPWMERQGNM